MTTIIQVFCMLIALICLGAASAKNADKFSKILYCACTILFVMLAVYLEVFV